MANQVRSLWVSAWCTTASQMTSRAGPGRLETGRGGGGRRGRRGDATPRGHVVRDPCQLLRHERCVSPGLVVCGKNRCRGSSGVSVSRRLVSSLVSRVPPVVAHGRVRADGRRREENRETETRNAKKGKRTSSKHGPRKSEFSRKE